MDSAMDTLETHEDTISPSVRRSGRKKVPTALYGQSAPEISSSQSTQKESQDEVEETSEYKETGNTHNQESDETSDSDNVPLSHFSPGKGRKRSGKPLKKLPSAKKTKAARLKSRTSFEDSEGHGSMFDIIKAGKGALQALVDDWIVSYNKDRTSAMVDLIQFFIQCCGCRGEVTEDMLEEEENVNAIRKLTEEFDEESHEYPLTMSGATYKKFKTNFCEFIDRFVEQCQHTIVYDEFMMEKLISWLISLSDSQVRAFRHTSTLAGMKLAAALIQIALKVNVELDNTQRQLDSEKQKTASKRGVQKMEMLQNKKNQLRDNVKELEEFMCFIFQGIFVHRYRDVRPEIRSLCISEIGCWMKEYSTLFLSHKYLKYIVWTLHDKVGDVRLHALQALLQLYEVEEFLPQLEPLTKRFKGRLVAMTLDKENDVTAEAIRLVTLLFRYGELDEEDCQQVEQLVFCSHRQVSHEAGYFLHERLMAEAEAASPSKKRASKKSEFQKKCEYMKRLNDFFINGQIHNHASYLVDSIWQHCDILKDWKVMTGMLMEEDGSSEDLSDDEETALIEIMTCCCRQAALGQGPPGRAVKRLLTTKERKTIVNDKQEMSAHFMVRLPALLGKYGTDLPKAKNLVTIPQYFDLEEYSQRRLGQHFEDLLDQIDDLVQKGPEMPLLEECAKTYRTLTDNELTLRSKAEVARNKLMDNVVELFKDGCKNFTLETVEPNEEEDNADTFAVEVNLKRITAFYKSHDLGAWDLFEPLRALAANNSSDEIASMALVSLQMLLLWSFHALDCNHPNKRDMKTLKQRSITYISLCKDSLDSGISGEVRKQAFLCISDTLIVFAKQLKNNYPLLSMLGYQAPKEFQLVCSDFVIDYVFSDLTEDEEKEDEEDDTENDVEELNSKRVVLAGFCKFIAYGIFDMSTASRVFCNMISGFGNFGDIIKHTMAKCREINKNGYTKTIGLTLRQKYKESRRNADDDNSIVRTSVEFADTKDLAKRLSLTFGIDPSKSVVRTSMITLHRDAIAYSFDGSADSSTTFPNMLFLEVINECTYRLIPQDKKVVLKYLQEAATKAKLNLDKLGKNLQSLSIYYKALKEGIQAAGGKTDKSSRARPLAQKAKRKLVVEGGETSKRRSLNKTADLQSKADEEEDVDENNETSPESTRQSEDKTAEDLSQQSTKRKRDVVESDRNTDEEMEPNSEDEFQGAEETMEDKEDREPDNEVEDEEASEVESEEQTSPKVTPPAKRTRKAFPEDVFEESPAQDTESGDDLAPAF